MKKTIIFLIVISIFSCDGTNVEQEFEIDVHKGSIKQLIELTSSKVLQSHTNGDTNFFHNLNKITSPNSELTAEQKIEIFSKILNLNNPEDLTNLLKKATNEYSYLNETDLTFRNSDIEYKLISLGLIDKTKISTNGRIDCETQASLDYVADSMACLPDSLWCGAAAVACYMLCMGEAMAQFQYALVQCRMISN